MNICGYQKTTLLDYPGHVAATIFTGGCNFRCPFCHNSDLLLNPTTVISEDEIFSFLKKRKNILSGICITGGDPGEVACIDTQDPSHPFYEAAQAAVKALETATDAKGRRLKVHRVALPKKPVLLAGAETIAAATGSAPRKNGDLCIASYLNFLICNGGVIVPQYDDENDALALRQLQAVFPDKKVVGVRTREIVYGGGNIHCITQQVPDPTAR